MYRRLARILSHRFPDPRSEVPKKFIPLGGERVIAASMPIERQLWAGW